MKFKSFKTWEIQNSMFRPLQWTLSVFMIAYLWNACGDLLNPEDEETVSSTTEEMDPALINYISYEEADANGKKSSSSTTTSTSGGAIGMATRGPSSLGGAVGGLATAGGALDEGATGESAERTITYENYDSSGFKYFAKMTEPESTYTEVGKPFALQFVAIGRFPLKYTWYKLSASGKSVVGTDSTVLSKVTSQLVDAGKYYATVEDADGNVLTSRTVEVKVRPSDRACAAGNFGPSNGNTREALVPADQVAAGYKHLVVSLLATRATHVIDIDCNGTSLIKNCTGELTYQCLGGKYVKVDGQCSCDNGGGG